MSVTSERITIERAQKKHGLSIDQIIKLHQEDYIEMSFDAESETEYIAPTDGSLSGIWKRYQADEEQNNVKLFELAARAAQQEDNTEDFLVSRLQQLSDDREVNIAEVYLENREEINAPVPDSIVTMLLTQTGAFGPEGSNQGL